MLARGARRAARPVSGLGWGVVVAALVTGAVGWWLGWVELSVVAAALAGFVLSALGFTIGRSTYAVDLDLSTNRVTVGQRAVGRLEVRNTSRRRLLPAQIELPVGQGSADFHLPSLGPRAAHEDVFAIPTTRRAVVVVGPVRSVRGDPVGLVRRRVRWTEPVNLYVHPELVSLGGAAAGVLRDLEGQATRVISDSDMSFHALRAYVAGDDRRHIHWKTSARVGELMVRQFEDTRRTHTAVALSTASADYRSVEEFELAVSATASIGVQALRDQRDLTVLAGSGALRTASPPRLLDDCSAIEATSSGRSSEHLAQWVARQAPDASVAILVTGSVPSRRALRAHAARLPVGVRALILLCGNGEPVDVVQHGSLTLAQLGSLADLPRVLRRVVAG
ncbi:DUF58 domain-containing protein [Pengzhenrongella frigida]|uniref:DUF58 domain-containing protein n=1 Tax=Pengzhenrongella frigida TaxID=1259133 RepID=A0A4Q5N3B4_9MICO|nr:DUF58 domain-containing protein [Cellulomonas sp. HLT2-17]RYV52626.1 DUF58 domain-containing protein [Cellulomonas sp. HLT2-17]